MAHDTPLGVFFLMVLGIIAIPGMDMAVVLANALAGGPRRGLMAVGGVIAGGFCHVLAYAIGVGLLVQLWPALFNALLLAGAAYIAWIGWSLLRSSTAVGALPLARGAGSHRAAFRQAAVTNLLNPKAYLFMFAVFPQFIQPGQGHVALQATALGAIIALTQATIYGVLALAVGARSKGMKTRPGLQTGIFRTTGAVLLAAAMFTAVESWRRL